MKKLISLLLALSLMAVAVVAFGEAAENQDQVGVYTVYNETGEKVTELYLIDNTTGEKGENLAVDDENDGIAAGEVIDLEYAIPAGEDGKQRLTLSFKTEGGYEASFATLSIEVAPITLLAADAMTGATMIAFKAQNWDCAYTIYNVTGEPVTELTLTDNVTGDVVNLLENGPLADGESLEASYTLPKNEDAHGRLTLAFKTESGYEGSFATLSIEVAPISLLAADAMTGATMISFKAPEGK